MLIKESVLRPEIFQIQSASQAKTHTEKNTGQHKVEFFMQWHMYNHNIYIQQNLGNN